LRSLLEDWQKSGKGAWTYARENGLIPQTFFGWTKKEIKGKQGFVELRTHGASLFQTSQILIEKADIKIHLPAGASINDIRVIIESLRVTI